MTFIAQRMQAAVAILDLIDRKREEMGDAALGASIERCLIDVHLQELERDLLEPVPVRRRRAGSGPPRP